MQANTSQHVYGFPGRHSHLGVSWGGRTSGTASRQSRAAQPARYHVARGWRGPHPHQTAVARKVGSWGIQQDTPAPVDPPRSILTHETPSGGFRDFGGNRAKIRHPRPVQSAMHRHYAPHKPMIGLAVSPGGMGTRANTSRHVYGPPGRHSHLNVPWRRPPCGKASRYKSNRSARTVWCGARLEGATTTSKGRGRSSGVLGHPTTRTSTGETSAFHHHP